MWLQAVQRNGSGPPLKDSPGGDQSLYNFHHTVVDSLLYGTVHFNLSNVGALQWTLSNSDTHYILSLRSDAQYQIIN